MALPRLYCGYYTIRLHDRSKSQPTNTAAAAGQQKNFTLRNGCQVRRVIHQGGRAEALQYTDSSGEEIEQPANIVVVARGR
jgi:choline dehydrogenase-like flavoprotein